MQSSSLVSPVRPHLRGLRILESIPLWSGAKTFDLRVSTALMASLGNPQDMIRTIHVAGTNGKGSVSAMMASVLRAAGNHVGQFASPHLTHVSERCLLDGKPANLDLLNAAIEKVLAASETLQLRPSFFEIICAASFLVFAEQKVDYAVIEVGLGGRLDATNVIRQPEIALITSIGFDHEHILGDTLEKIAIEKAGIAKPGAPLISAALDPGARQGIAAVVAQIGCPWRELRDQDIEPLLEGMTLSLVGPHQRRNAALVCAAAEMLGISRGACAEGVRTARWPGRLELVQVETPAGERDVLMDAAHNPEGLTALLRYLDEAPQFQQRRLRICLSILARKDWQQMLHQLQAFASKWELRTGVKVVVRCSSSGHSQAVSPEALQELLPGAAVSLEPEEALASELDDMQQNDLLVVTGSIYFIGRVRPILVKEEFRTIA